MMLFLSSSGPVPLLLVVILQFTCLAATAGKYYVQIISIILSSYKIM